MKQLRPWQLECINQALSVYQTSDHFLCYATPGSGKTLMVASLAKALIKRDQIDLVFCFSPSRTVAQKMASIFKESLGKRFDGQIGAVGASHTYQSMNTLPEAHWHLLEECRVLVVLDEIHHCSGFNWGSIQVGNSWGRDILNKIQGKARYTIALSGTPWRTDDTPIALSNYTEGGTQINCDFQYGLKPAVSDGVCRKPKIVLTDNREISLRSPEFEPKSFTSIRESLQSGPITYRDFLYKNEIVDHVLLEATAKLSEIRQAIPDAGGLVVASSIEHAYQIWDRLALLGENPTIVNHHTPRAPDIISNFEHSSASWIISVGMISEGTDIPRLQVCCHLSRIRTELHFRQILGRILRTRENEPQNADAWLYVLAEPNLEEFARRLGQELPGDNVVSFSPKTKSTQTEQTPATQLDRTEVLDLEWTADHPLLGKVLSNSLANSSRRNPELSISDQYLQEVLSLFDTTS